MSVSVQEENIPKHNKANIILLFFVLFISVSQNPSLQYKEQETCSYETQLAMAVGLQDIVESAH